MADLTYMPKLHKADGGDTLVAESGAKFAVGRSTQPAVPQFLRVRVPTADVNAGLTLLAAAPGYRYRLVDCGIIAYGGAMQTLTTVDILGTRSGAVKLVAFGQANLTQSTLVKAGGTGGTILADGASFTAVDENTAITIGKTGSNGATATGVDVLITYVLEVV